MTLVRFAMICGLVMFATAPAVAQPSPAAVRGFDSYVNSVEGRLAQQHRSRNSFLALAGHGDEARLRKGDLVVEQITPPGGGELPGGLLHHWRGTAFVRGARAADFERLMENFGAYPREFSPQVLRTTVLEQEGDRYLVAMRICQRHAITVVMDATYDIVFGQLDAQRGYSISRSVRIAEIESPGSRRERALSPGEAHGFLWRMNTYWSYEERDDGLYVQVETVSLTRAIPRGLGWAIGPYLETIPRESLDFTLRSVCDALGKKKEGGR